MVIRMSASSSKMATSKHFSIISLSSVGIRKQQRDFLLPELIEAFSLDGLQIANGIFDPETQVDE